LSNSLTIDKLLSLANDFEQSFERKTVQEDGWCIEHHCNVFYSISKIFLNYYTRLLAERRDIIERDIQVYSCTPGNTRTEMGGPTALRSLEEGLKTPLFMMELESKIDPEIQGKFFFDEKVEPIDQLTDK